MPQDSRKIEAPYNSLSLHSVCQHHSMHCAPQLSWISLSYITLLLWGGAASEERVVALDDLNQQQTCAQI